MEPRPGAADGIGNSADSFILAHHPLLNLCLHLEQFLCLPLQESSHRDAGPLRHDLGDILFVHLLLEHHAFFLDGLELLLLGIEFSLELGGDAVTKLRHLAEVPLPFGLLLLHPALLEAFLDLSNFADDRFFPLPARLQCT